MRAGMAVRGETRRRLVSGTLRLLRRRGLHGVGLQEVLAGQRGEKWMRRCLEGSPTVAGGVARMLGEYADLLEASAFADGCPVAAVALDLSATPGPLQAACGRALDSWVTLVAAALRGEGRSAPEAESLALATISAFEGALLVARARRDASAVRAVAVWADSLLSSAG